MERGVDVSGPAAEGWYWCLRHARVEPRDGCRGADRLGPFTTPEAAQSWRSTFAERNERWDEEQEGPADRDAAPGT